MENPVASIILLAYNHEKSVAQAIESVLAQKCRYPYEIVIAEDCSTDGTRDICEEYAQRYPEIVRMMPEAPNKGLVDNYYDTLLACRGRYISDCAADDHWLDENLLEREIDILEADPTLTVVFPDVAENGVRLHSSMPQYARWMRPRVPGQEILLGVLNNTNALPYQLSAALYRKEAAIESLRENPELVRNPECGVEDLPLMTALASKGDAAYIPMVGYYYTIDDSETISNNLPPEKAFRFYACLLSFVPRLADHYGIDKRALKTHFQTKYNYIAAMARKSRNRRLLKDLRVIRTLWRPVSPILKSRIHTLLLRLGL